MNQDGAMRILSTSSVRGDGGGGSGIFYDPRPLIVGDAPFVGVIDFPATLDRPPVRLYYPAEESTSSSSSSSSSNGNRRLRPARYFSGNRFAHFLLGYAHVAFARHTTWFHMYFLRPLLWFFSFLAPIRYLKIPYTAHVTDADGARALNYIPPSSLRMRMAVSSGDEKKDNGDDEVMQKQRLVLFSHGLTGTGEENSIFCSSLAKRGYVVASIHHRDGSSNQVQLHDGSRLYYKHFPSGDAFDPRDRLQQVQIRAKEMLQCRSWLVDGPEGISDDGDDVEHRRIVLDQIRPHLKGGGAIAAGFSYGSTTAVLAATLEPNNFCCVLLLDPWLHIDYQSKGVAYDFPPEAFGQCWPQWPPSEAAETNTLSDTSQTKEGLKIPSLIISSSMFAGFEKLKGAMLRLADQTNSNADVHVIPDTAHQNFCDVAFWVPKRLLRGFIRLGDANAYDVHEEILDRTVRFLRRF